MHADLAGRVEPGAPRPEVDGPLARHSGIDIVEIGDASLVAEMTASGHTAQPTGHVHGAAALVFAETTDNLASRMAVDSDRFTAVDLDINANYVRPASSPAAADACVGNPRRDGGRAACLRRPPDHVYRPEIETRLTGDLRLPSCVRTSAMSMWKNPIG